MEIHELVSNMWIYNKDNVGDTFPMDMSIFYSDIWNDWRRDNNISLNDALTLWDWAMKADNCIENDNDYSLEHKTIQQEIKKLKIECDFE